MLSEEDKMSVSDLEKVTDSDLKKRLNELIDLYDWADMCPSCRRPYFLHKGLCTRTDKDPPEGYKEIWTEFKKRMKTVLRWAKTARGKEKDEAFLWEGFKS